MSGLADHLSSLDHAALVAFFEATDTAQVTEQIRALSPGELSRMLADDAIREVAVEAILGRFAEFAHAERLAAVEGVVCFDLARQGGSNESHTVAFTGGAVLLDATGPDVTIGADIADFVRLVTGQCNAALLYLADELRISGDEMLALAVGTIFRVPGTHEVAVDPSALDPVDVATAVARSTTKHMREVMASGFRGVVLGEVIRRFPDFLLAKKAEKLQLSVGFRVGGRSDGGVDRFVVHLEGGVVRMETNPAEGSRRDATIVVDGVDFLRLVTGQLNPVTGVLKGTLKVRGDKRKALALSAVMDPPSPRG